MTTVQIIAAALQVAAIVISIAAIVITVRARRKIERIIRGE